MGLALKVILRTSASGSGERRRQQESHSETDPKRNNVPHHASSSVDSPQFWKVSSGRRRLEE